MLVGLILTVIALALIFGGMFFFRKQLSGSLGAEKDSLTKSVSEVTSELDSLAKYSDAYVSKLQLESVVSRTIASDTELASARTLLKEIEGKLDSAQKNVDEKEAKQQEIKNVKEGEEAKLKELALNFESMSQEAVDLEKQLAASLKELDALMTELELNQVQKEAMQVLSQALLGAGSRLRDLIMEYQTVNERVEGLKQQHLDLEEEYTKLVEQQLGG